MSPTTATMRPSFQLCNNCEESYCAPWDLKTQEEKLKLLNKQHQVSLTDTLLHSSNINNQSTFLSFNHNNTNKSFHRTCSVRTSSLTKKSFTHRELSPPVLPPLPSGGFIPLCQCGINNNSIIEKFDKKMSNCLNSHAIHSGTDTSRSFLSPSNKHTQKIDTDDTEPISFETALLHFQHLSSLNQNNSLPKTSTIYEQPWDTLQTNHLSSKHNHHGGSLQKLPSTKQHCSPPVFPIISLCRHSKDMITIPIDRYFWYHYGMSRRQAENVLQTRSSGSFLVRQSESGNQNDYSLSIKTTKGCMHMRICYSEGFYILGECSRPFSSVSCMIKYFSQISVPIRGAAHIKLGKPVLRWEILSSSLSNEEIL